MAVAVLLVGARVWRGEEAVPGALALRETALAHAPADAPTVDLDGLTLFPALVNAHDHLELNHYPRTRPRERYANAHAWGEDVNALLDAPPFAARRAVPLRDRVFAGGLKNLLGGALTVAHHNPPHRALFTRDFPVTVVRRYGWAHSLHFETPERVAESLRATPPDAPWFIHLAEGTDGEAAGEYGRLRALRAARPNAVLVHGVGLADDDRRDAAARVRGLVWCPSTNAYLLGATADVRAWLEAGGRLGLGSDSRLTADGDLLDELRAARRLSDLPDAALVRMATTGAADLLGLAGVGTLAPGARADLIALRAGADAAAALVGARRAALALVMRGGVPQIGDPDVMRRFRRVPLVEARLDGAPKLIHAALARRLVQWALSEPGLEIDREAAAQPSFVRRLWKRGRA